MPRCSNCGTFTIDRDADQEIDRAFRKAAGLMTAGEIGAAREQLGLTAHEFATLVGVTDAMVERLTPIWEGRTKLTAKPSQVEEIVRLGCKRAQVVSHQTLEEVNEAMKI